MRRFYKPSLWIPQHFLLTNPNLHHGLLIDDYYFWEGCTMAVNEYAAQKKWPIQQRGKICYITIP